jgi:gliding motility-associated-like protein
MLKNILFAFVCSFFFSGIAFSQTITVSATQATGHFASTNTDVNGCSPSYGLPAATLTFLSGTGSHVNTANGTLVIDNPCDSTRIKVEINNIHWSKNPSNNWIHGFYFLENGFTLPVSQVGLLSTAGWSYYPGGVTGPCSSIVFPKGFFFDGNNSHAACCPNSPVGDGIPQNNYGDPTYDCPQTLPTFIFEIVLCNGAVTGSGFPISVAGTSDYQSGCWNGLNGVSDTKINLLIKTQPFVGLYAPPAATISVTKVCTPTTMFTSTLTAGCGNGATVTWWSAVTGGTLLGTGSPFPYTTPTCSVGTTVYEACCPDGNLCNSRKPYLITGTCPPGLVMTAPAVTQPTCIVPTGTIDASGTVTGGSGTITYTINGGSPNTTGIFGGLAPGGYTVTATDAAGCQASQSVTINPVTGATFTPSATTVAASCPGVNNGSITVTVVPTGTYTYTLDGDATTTNATGIFPNVSGGAHTVTVANATCNATINVTVGPGTAPAAPTATSPIAYCQNAAAVPLTATGTGLLWYTAATGGTGSATAPTPITTAAGTTTYYVSQTTTGPCESPRTPIVVNVTATPAAPTVTSPISYCQNDAAAQLTATGTGLLWYTAATGGAGSPTAPTPATGTIGSTTYYVSQTVSTCESPRAAIVVNVTAPPAAPTVTTPVEYCRGAAATALTATGTGLLWYTSAAGGTGSPTAPTPITTATGNTIYYVSQTSGTCESPRAAITVTINPTPAAPTVTSPVAYCQNAAATPLTATGTGLLWYTAATGGTGSTTAPTPITTAAGTITYYVSQTTGTCEGPRAAIQVDVTANPAAPTVTTPVDYCQGNTATTLTATGTNLLWYTAATGGTGSATAPTPITTATGSTTYYVSQSTGTCEGPRAAIVVNVTTTPAAPTVTTPVEYCQGAAATALTATGTGLLWYTSAAGGTGSPTAPTPITSATGNTIYYVSQTSGTCEGPRAAITVTINPTPAAPTVTSPVAYCQNAAATPLTATGTGLLWYTAATGGTGSAIAPTPITTAAGSTTYYVSQTTGTCEGPRAAIQVDVTATPAAPTVTTPVDYCQNAAATPLTATGTGLLWYTAATGGTGSPTAPTPITTATGSTTYYVSQSTGTCEGPRAAIIVNVTTTPAAPTVTTPVAYCQNAAATPLTATGTGLLWYTAATGGTGNPTAPTPSTTAAGTTTYYVSQTTGTCEGPRAAIQVDVTATPAAPTVTSPVAYCQNAAATPLTATGTGLLWYTAATGGTGDPAAPTPSTTAAGTTTYYVSSTAGICEGPRAAIQVDVTATPAAPTVTTPVDYCQGNTATALTATGTNLLWYTAATGGTGDPAAPTPSTTTVGSTTYYVSQSTGTCEGPRAAIIVNVTITPAAPAVTTPVAYCQNAAATPLTATGTGLLWYTAATGGTGNPTAPTPSTTAAGSTIYYVSQTTGTCEGPRAAIQVDVTATPAAPTVTSPVAYCEGSTATALTATGTGLLWYTAATGGTGSATAPTPITTAAGTTTYYVSQTTGTCEGPRAAIQVDVTATPAAPTVTTPVEYCQGTAATALTATGTNLLWYTTATGGTGDPAAPTPSTTTVGNTTYYVSQTTGTCEGPRAAIVVTINTTPAAPAVTTPVAYCQNAAATPLTATGTGLLWYTTATGGTGSATAPTPSTTAGGTTTYYVSSTAGTCEGPRAEITVNVTATPAAPGVTTPVNYCPNATAAPLTATGTNLLWYTAATGGTGSATAPTPNTSVQATTTYYVSQSTNTCEGPRAAIVVVVNNGLTVDLGKDTTICQGLSVKFTPVLSIPGTSFQWRSITPVVPNSTIDTLNISDATVSPVDTAQYVLRVTAGGCATEDTVKVNVIWKPIVNAGPSAVSICLGDSVLLIGSVTHTSGPIDSLVWTPTDSLTTPVSNQTWAHPVNNTYYHLTAFTSVANYGCLFTPQAYDSIKVVIPAPVIASAGRDTIAVKGQPHQLLGSGGVSYEWSSPTPSVTITSPLSQNPFVTLYNDANFSVIVKNATGCADTASVFVKVLDGPMYYVPNAFSPNGDGLNDVFRAIPAGMANTQYFKVMNRYGETVFETNQYLKGWDGTFKGKKQPLGVYVWFVKGQDKDGKTVEMKGTVMLVQ